MIKKLTQRIKELIWMVKLAEDNASRMYTLEKRIRELTTVSVDICPHRHAVNNIIVVGRYKGIDYVQTYTINDKDFKYIIDMLRTMQKTGVIDKIDAMPPIKAFVKEVLDY